MSGQEENQIILIPVQSSPQKIETSIAAFNEPLANLLQHVGLPTEDILSPIEERRKVIYALESTIEILPIDERAKSTYLSKFTVAISVGLFDGALNFLWDETVKSLRRLAVNFDLQYFLGVAKTLNTKYKNLVNEDDLSAIGDHDLLEISRRIGLINDINHKRLEHVNYLRNHASAAHPNENYVSGIEMLSLLEACLKYAIVAKPDHSVIQIQQLFDNLRTKEIPKEDFEIIGDDLRKQPQERIDDFVLSLVGIYIDPKTESLVKKNIDRLAPKIWDILLEDTKLRIGAKFGLYRKNGDVDRKDAIQSFLEKVDGLKYKDEDSLAAELLEKLQNLKTIHFEWNNFYNERAHAKSIKDSIPANGIPDAVRKLFVKVITICYVGNGLGYKEGVDEVALPYYKEFIEGFTITEIKDFVHLFKDPEFTSDFRASKADVRLRKMANFFKAKTKDVYINRILDLIISYPKNSLNSIASHVTYREAIKFI
ncbi:hypothetical protein AM493_03625 [Flavobacterium akiainvivens]|uniref:Uncharacterized protein n=1 Tax=Flavobacterium akiainvivens TaxID=1202724 RepID=A0A0M8MGE7_9FLAO|nr:hypothetical protein [Flavobacterium akiainvivens]KOS05227.1 hypothetical protein AM493_03625 [Flavobacterium akiainvivens]SFQ50438.1 hypothetical protein SAMN05444144_10678 [Flavobacterium akiainvivens]